MSVFTYTCGKQSFDSSLKLYLPFGSTCRCTPVPFGSILLLSSSLKISSRPPQPTPKWESMNLHYFRKIALKTKCHERAIKTRFFFHWWIESLECTPFPHIVRLNSVSDSWRDDDFFFNKSASDLTCSFSISSTSSSAIVSNWVSGPGQYRVSTWYTFES